MSNLIKQSVKKTGRAHKEQLVASLTQKFDSANGLVFTNYQGLTHQQLEELKIDLKKLDAKIVIAKNSLIKIALNNSKDFKEAKDNEGLNNPTATLLIQGGMIEPLKALKKSIKSYGLPSIKFGVLEGSIVDEAGVLQIASLPGRDMLLTQVVGLLNSPIQGFVSTLNSIPQKFVMTLDTIAKNKPTDSIPATEQKNEATPPMDEPGQTNEKTSKVDKSDVRNQKSEADSSEATPETSESKEEGDKSNQGGDN